MISFNVTLQIPEDFIDDVLVAAFEGGINYWCKEVIVVDNDYCGGKYASEVVRLGGTVQILADEDDDRYILNYDTFMRGLRKYVQNGGTLDLTILDANDADTIVQYAIFDEIVYG